MLLVALHPLSRDLLVPSEAAVLPGARRLLGEARCGVLSSWRGWLVEKTSQCKINVRLEIASTGSCVREGW